MSISLYYSAARAEPLTAPERALLDGIAARHGQTFGDSETFGFYAEADTEPENILEGAVKLPSSDVDLQMEAVMYWREGLAEIRRAFPADGWHVHVDDIDLLWDEEFGFYHFPGEEVS